jgi:hypothetical protein
LKRAAPPVMMFRDSCKDRPMLDRRTLCLALGAGALAPRGAAAQAGFPDRPLRWVVGYPPPTPSRG